MKINSDIVMKWSVSFTNVFYDFAVRNLYFLLSNMLFFLSLIVFDVTMNNLLIYTLPIFLYINSYSVQFELIKNKNSNNYEWKDYIETFKRSMRSGWKIYLTMTLLIQFLLINLWIVIRVSELNFMLIPIIITGAFMINSFYYYLNYYLFKSFKVGMKSVSSSLILSYGNLPAFLKNTLVLIIKLLLGFLISPIIVLIFGDLVSRIIMNNIRQEKLHEAFNKKVDSDLEEFRSK